MRLERRVLERCTVVQRLLIHELCFLCFKQKTAYEMRISDWSSDVCSSDLQKQTAGTVLGAVGGGLLGSTIGKGSGRLVAVGAGTLLGGLIGSEIGNSLDKADRTAAADAYHRAGDAPIGETIKIGRAHV